MKRAILITALFMLALGIYLFNYKGQYEGGFKHSIDDTFISDKSDLKIYFYFIEVSDYYEDEIRKIGESIKEKLSVDSGNIDGVLVCYFYKGADKTNLPKTQKNILKRIYPSKPKLHEKLDFYKKAYIFTASTTDKSIIYKNNKISSGKLVKTDIIIPKKGTNAYFILLGSD